MQIIADLHLHSKYSRAVSKDMTLPVMASFAQKKGINLLTTADWTHPLWFKEIQSQLEEAGKGVYKLKTGEEPLFLLSTEISSIYSQDGKLRRIHNLVFTPSFEAAGKIIKELQKRGCNLMADGRPIIGLSSKQLLELILEVDKACLLIPCHAWTPHFGVYGSASGFNSITEAFGGLDSYIYGIETGLSSDPEMNWQIQELMDRSILSFSDAHSPAKMGREATVFVENKNGMSNVKSQISNNKITYDDIAKAIKRDPKGNLKIGYTIEFYPEEGKYHFSGHRNCGVVRGVEEIKKDGSTCPVCSRRLTEGVLYRLGQLGSETLLDRSRTKESPHGIKWIVDAKKNPPPFVRMVPLLEILAESLGSTVFSQKTKTLFDDLCKKFDGEFSVLLTTPIEEIQKTFGDRVAEGVLKVRRGDIVIQPGYDGEYGKVQIWHKESVANKTVVNTQEPKNQLGLF